MWKTSLILIFVSFLTACADPEKARVIPEPLLRPVVVVCEGGTKSKNLGDCALALRAGLNTANSQILAIAEIEKGPR